MNDKQNLQDKAAKTLILLLAIAAGGMFMGYGIAEKNIYQLGFGLGLTVIPEIYLIRRLVK